MRMLTLRLRAVKPPALALTHGPPADVGIGGAAQPLAVMSRAPTVTRAWNDVRETLRLLFCRRSVKPPLAFVLGVNRGLPATSSCTRAPATGAPPCWTRPLNVTIFLTLFDTFAFSVTEPGPTNESACTVPAGFGRPVPAPHGVNVETH